MSQTNEFLSRNRIARGEIFYVVPQGNEVTQGEFVGGRPAIVVSNDMNNEFNGIVEVVYMTRAGKVKHDLPTNVPINTTGQASVALCGQIYTVNKKRIGKYIGQCSIHEMKKIDRAMCVGLCTDDIFDQRNITDVLAEWKKRIRLSPDTEEIEVVKSEYDDAEPIEKSDEPIVQNVDNSVDNSTEKTKPEQSEPTVVDVTTTEEFIKVKTERDIYKDMYNDLLKKCLKAGMSVE